MGRLPALVRGQTLERKESQYPQTSPGRMWLMPSLSSPRSLVSVLHCLKMASSYRSSPLRTIRCL